MKTDLVIGCVGKPSAGKSSFLNSVTGANAKVGNYPFTTIEPNNGVTAYTTQCPCVSAGKTDACAPRYGKCVNGVRHIPIKVLDVAGLVPGAAEGLGLGNKFLDDLRHADVLLHIVDVSGTTNEKGEATKGYDPTRDVQWLMDEIHAWVFTNLWTRWGSITRRHVAAKENMQTTLLAQLSGYGSRMSLILKVIAEFERSAPADAPAPALEHWTEADVRRFVQVFLSLRFPIVLVLNKIDSPDADRNIARICERYDADSVVLASALSELFLVKMAAAGYIRYTPGDESFETSQDIAEMQQLYQERGEPVPKEYQDVKLKLLDDKNAARLEKLRDLVLFRHGSTGVQRAVQRAVELRAFVPVYPVRSLASCIGTTSGHVFSDCYLVPPGTTVREFGEWLSPEIRQHYAYAEGRDGRRLGEADVFCGDHCIVRYVTSQFGEEKS